MFFRNAICQKMPVQARFKKKSVLKRKEFDENQKNGFSAYALTKSWSAPHCIDYFTALLALQKNSPIQKVEKQILKYCFYDSKTIVWSSDDIK